MKSYNTTNLSDNIRLLHDEARTLLKQKKDDEQIIDHLISKGCERHYAELVLENVRSDNHNRKNFWKTLFYGIAFLVAGLALTLGSRLFAINTGGGFYFVFWGIAVAGISIIARAFIVFRK